MRTIYFWGEPRGFEQAKRLADEDKARSAKALTRNAGAFDGELEMDVDRVVVLDSVPPWQAARIRDAYEQGGSEVVVQANGAAIEKPKRPRVPLPLTEKLRRLPTRQLKDLARDRGVDLSSAQDRAQMIAAIETAAKEPTP
jgi:hypothetical protein